MACWIVDVYSVDYYRMMGYVVGVIPQCGFTVGCGLVYVLFGGLCETLGVISRFYLFGGLM